MQVYMQEDLTYNLKYKFKVKLNWFLKILQNTYE